MRLCAAVCGCVRLCAAVCGCVRLCTAVRGCAWLCAAVRGCVRLCAAVRRCAPLCVAVRRCAPLCAAVRGCARLCAAVRGCAWLCAAVRGCARLCAAVHGCAWLCAVVRGRARPCAAVRGCARLCVAMRAFCPRTAPLFLRTVSTDSLPAVVLFCSDAPVFLLPIFYIIIKISRSPDLPISRFAMKISRFIKKNTDLYTTLYGGEIRFFVFFFLGDHLYLVLYRCVQLKFCSRRRSY